MRDDGRCTISTFAPFAGPISLLILDSAEKNVLTITQRPFYMVHQKYLTVFEVK